MRFFKRWRKKIQNGGKTDPNADEHSDEPGNRFDEVTTADICFVRHFFLLLFQLPFKDAGGGIHVGNGEGGALSLHPEWIYHPAPLEKSIFLPHDDHRAAHPRGLNSR
ncbi:MAG: hypothetical protein HND47_24925 [Chloroflexi bacterium]|nr:hypothetical protein [Chloroflexota bacterium]